MRRQTILANGTIYSLEREGECFESMLIGPDGRIKGLYRKGEKPDVDVGGAETLDLCGKAVVPAFIDTHTHFMSKAALESLAVNLARLENGRIVPDSLEGVRALLSERAEQNRSPVVGFGLCLGALAERRLPRASELDAWLPNRDVVVFSMDGHSSSYSSSALKKLGMERMASDGVLAGEAHEFNMGKVTSFIMKHLNPAVLAQGLSAAVKEAVDGGIVSIHCLEGTEDSPSDPGMTLFKLAGGRLGLRLKLWMQYTDICKAGRHAGHLAYHRAGGCLAWEMDGSVSSRTAAFDIDYLDRRDSGKLYRTADDAYTLVKPFYSAGWQTSAHAIGPRGIESILSAYERLMDEANDSENRLRLRIDHFEFPRPDQVERAGRRRLVLTVQPGFAWADERFIHSYEEALDPRVRAFQCPLRQLADAGCSIALSTDAPVQPLNPFFQIAGAVRHPVPSARLTVYEALRAYSWAGAYAAFEEHERGTLAIGKYADFAVLNTDPFSADPDTLHDIQVTATWHEGRPLGAPPPDLAGFLFRLLTTKGRKL